MKLRFIKAVLCLLVFSAGIFPLKTDAQQFSAEEIKAQYIIKMRPFISIAGHPVRKICYYEKLGVPESESVGQLITKHLKGHQQELSVKWFKAIGNFSDCDIFFIPSSEEGNIDDIISSLNSYPVLTISAAKGFIYRGGMIGFVTDEDDHIKMEVNLKNVKSKNISIQAKILELMLHVVN